MSARIVALRIDSQPACDCCRDAFSRCREDDFEPGVRRCVLGKHPRVGHQHAAPGRENRSDNDGGVGHDHNPTTLQLCPRAVALDLPQSVPPRAGAERDGTAPAREPPPHVSQFERRKVWAADGEGIGSCSLCVDQAARTMRSGHLNPRS